uniref:RAB17, member RAS onco family n=1 Tax=Gopherus evgoodei TaxID=1825980 RepID=A0A8C4YBY1_9SAUR
MAPRRTQQVGAGRPSTEQAYISKVVLLGSTAVGKSSTAFRYVKNDIRESMTTVGCSFFTQLGTAGQEMYHSVCHLYYRGANAAFLVYDIARKATFARAKLWLRELEKEFLPDELVIVLVSNKADLAAQREVTFEVKSVTAVRSQHLADSFFQKHHGSVFTENENCMGQKKLEGLALGFVSPVSFNRFQPESGCNALSCATEKTSVA